MNRRTFSYIAAILILFALLSFLLTSCGEESDAGMSSRQPSTHQAEDAQSKDETISEPVEKESTSSGEKVTAREIPAPPVLDPFDLIIHYEAGDESSPAALLVTMVNQRARDEAMKAELAAKEEFYKKRLRNTGPVKLHVTKEQWAEVISLVVEGDDSSTESLAGKLAPVSFPPAEFVLDANTVATVVMEVPPELKPSAGSRVHAEFSLDGINVSSSSLTVPEAPKDAKERLISSGRVAHMLEDDEGLMDISEKLIALDKDEMAGYWYKGLAYEMKGEIQKAIEAYMIAVENSPDLIEPNDEVPLHILYRLTDLEDNRNE